MLTPAPNTGRARRWWAALAVLVVAGPATAQVPGESAEVLPAYARSVLDGTPPPAVDPAIVQAGCASCGQTSPVPAILGPVGGGGSCLCSDACDSCTCKPGKNKNCPIHGCPPETPLGRLIHGIGMCVCCPDPCYEPVWVTTANSAFFVDSVRPRTYTRVRWDSGLNVVLPDRAEYFWAREAASGGGGRGPKKAEHRVDYDELSFYTEAAAGAAGFFVETPYRTVSPEANPQHANFADLNLGTKSLLIDCELLQLGFQFKTFIPSGGSRNGLGTGHTSLEPAFLASLKVCPDTYLQGQLAEWIPVGGDPTYQGSILHYHLSLNRLWLRKGACQLITTGEFNCWTFQDGALTIPVTPDKGTPTKASGETYVSLGGGVRLVFCENFDIGFGTAQAVTSDHWAQNLYRTELRLRY